MNNYVIAPESDIYLIKCPLEMDSLNQLDFASVTAQTNYFMSLPKVYMDDATYVRKDGRIYFEGSYDTLCTYNYCMYRNTNYSTKWFYAFVSDMRYESNNSISADLTTDVYQTWIFDVTIKRSFIERTHVSVSSDTAGAYIYPEGLETGDYICNDISSIDLGGKYYVVGVTKRFDTSPQWASSGGIYSGIYSGVTYYATNDSAGVDGIISMYSTGHADDINEIFIAPEKLIHYGLENGSATSITNVKRLAQSGITEQVANTTIARPSSIDGYTPRNKKLLIHPFQYLLVDNNAGNSVVYQYELFSTPSACVFKVLGSLTPGTSMSLLPVGYTNSSANADDSGGVLSAPNMYSNALTLGKFPICNWSTDTYTNWLTQNSVNMQYNVLQSTVGGLTSGASSGAQIGFMGGGFLGAGIGGALGGALGGMTSSYGAIWENDRAKYEHQFAPNQSKGNANAGDVITSSYANKPSFYKMSIRYDMARVIDDFFDLYGYKINRILNVNTTSRSNWNYIKTIDVNIIGDIPQADMQKLKSLYNNGFTIWHKPAYFMDYSQTNS